MKKIAAIITVFFRGSHADVLVPKFVMGFPTNEGLVAPRVEIVSLYIDQFPETDVGRQFADEHDIPIYHSIPHALKRGGDSLDVDGVLLIGEHGDYAWNEKEQQLFPRRPFMEQICGIMATSGRGVPVFNDKHLSHNWHDAKWMYDRARDLQAPFMAGSSLPLTWRSPWLEHGMGEELDEALAVGFSGLDIYGFHTLEMLQCVVERRRGDETGLRAVTCLESDDVWRAADERLWSRELGEAACDAIVDKQTGSMEEHCDNPALFVVEYRDGLKGSVLMLNGYVTGLAYACRAGNGSVRATEFYCQGHGGQPGPYAHFSYLGFNIEEMFLNGKSSYPVERTLLTSGVLETALTSRHEGHRRIETDWLDVEYRSYEQLPWRPTAPRPCGASLDPWPPV